ncbi:beta-ketoacyl-ACP synthase II [Aggregatilinea lenta]|uniref:beta-ketoacyl-ACP synthase II n=1 Tax=Aggregatilinea lenta TaxID=913108 RepID=UPI000E5BD432|nr:beta-ketoacyl-ACP synthase II [Aggregatilinea lenta]
MKRVVVTGLGIICPVGNSPDEAWQNASNGVSGAQHIPEFEEMGLEVTFGAPVKDFDPEAFLGRREFRRTDRVTQLGLYACKQALEDSCLDVSQENLWEIGVLMGTGIGGIQSLIDGINTVNEKGVTSVSPLLLPMMLPDSPSGKIAIDLGLRGPNMAIATACATGNNSIGEACEMIRRGAAVAMLAGSTEAGMVPLAMSSLNNMQAISRRNDDPQGASRPFSLNRDGFVVAEGAATLVLEELEHAKARGAHIYCELIGYGSTCDAYHVTAPLENGEGAQEAMRRALKNAGLTPEDISYINAHGTSTKFNDSSETKAIKAIFGEHAYNVPISSTKSVTGHLMGAAGSVEAVFSVKTITEQFIPPTINLNEPDPDCDLNYVPNVGTAAEVETVMSNSFGFGGHNAVLIFSKYNGND